MTTTETPRTDVTRTYASYAKPLWQRVILTREFAVIALLLVVFFYSRAEIPQLRRPVDGLLPAARRGTDPADRPADDDDHHHRRDRSVGREHRGLSSVLVGDLHQGGMSIPMAALVAILVGILCGAFNGFLIAYVGLPSLAVTIGTLALYRGLAVGLLGTTAVTDFPEKWTDLAKNKIGDTSYPVIMIPIVILIIAFVLLLHFTSFGRGVFDVGLNDEAAHFSGVNVARTKFLLFVMAGAVSAFAGIYFTLRYGSARGDNANGMELQVIAAVLLGGVSIFGGRGALHGVIAGVLLIGVLSSALRLDEVSANVINIIIGLLLVLSVMSTSFLSFVTRTTAGMRRKASRGLPERQQASAQHEGNNS
ncbi:ABC transporter permease [Aeromicrobium sp. UC242_57]|uniref:ABC transporter permease n=1 Tax=Aeromicrobium sp. UC242_57 TaxID=3374624 RepID=UPI0037B6AD0C